MDCSEHKVFINYGCTICDEYEMRFDRKKQTSVSLHVIAHSPKLT